MHRRFAIVAPVLSTLLAVPARQTDGDNAPRRITRIQEAIDGYGSARRCFILGDLDLNERDAQRIAKCLDAHGNWFVLLAASVRDQRYVDARQRSYTGLAAVKQALGKGLYSGTELGSRRDDAGKSVGCILCISFDPDPTRRGITLRFGQAHRDAGLDEDAAEWLQPARTALRDGLRIGDAVTDTIEAVERQLDRSRTASGRRAAWIGGGALALLLAMLGIAHLASRRMKRRAIARLGQWRESFAKQASEIIELRKWGEIIARNPRYEGTTKQLAGRITEDLRHVVFIRATAQQALQRAESLIHPNGIGRRIFNTFTAVNFRRALQHMSSTKIELTGVRGPDLEIAPGDVLWSGVEDLDKVAREAKSFDELVTDFDERAKRADEGIRRIRNCDRLATSSLEVLAARIDRFSHSITEYEEINRGEPTLALPALRKTLLPALWKQHEEASSAAERDPVGAVDITEAAESRVQKADESIEVMARAVTTRVRELRLVEDALRARDIAPIWIDGGLTESTLQADAFFHALPTLDEAVPPPELGAPFEKLAERASTALLLSRERLEQTLPTLQKLRGDIDGTREEIANALGLGRERVLSETNANPTQVASSAQEKLDGFTEELGDGNLDEARALLRGAKHDISHAREILRDTREALAVHPQRAARLAGENRHLKDSAVPRHAEMLRALLDEFDESVLEVESEGERVSLAHRFRDAGTHLDQAGQLLATADELRSRGALLEGLHALARVATFHELVELNMNQLRKRDALVRRLLRESETRMAEADRIGSDLEKRKDQTFVTRRTQREVEVLLGNLRELRRNPQAGRRNPFELTQQLERLEVELHEVQLGIEADRAAWAETKRSVALAEDMLERAEDAENTARYDDIADSREIIDARRDLGRLGDDLQDIDRDLDVPHGDWDRLDARADEIHSRAAECLSILREEIERGRRALGAVQRAGARVRDAATFRGPRFGKRVSGNPGRQDHASAKSALANGDYDAAHSYAESAASRAEDAIEDVERAEHRQQSSLRRSKRHAGLETAIRVGSVLLEGAMRNWSGHRRGSGSFTIPSSSGSSSRSDSGWGSDTPSVSFEVEDDSGFGDTHSW